MGCPDLRNVLFCWYRENGLTWLEEALEERSNGTVYMAVDRFFDPLCDDPRYHQAMQRVGLSDTR